MIYLEIADAEGLLAFIQEVKKKTGLLKDISLKQVEQIASGKEFPVRIPVSLDLFVSLASNPILKKIFGKKVEDAARRFLRKELSAV